MEEHYCDFMCLVEFKEENASQLADPIFREIMVKADEGSHFCLGALDKEDYDLVTILSEEKAEENLIIHQRNDPVISRVIEQKLAHGKRRKPEKDSIDHPWYRKHYAWLRLRDGVLYRSSKIDEVPEVVLQAVIPPTLVEQVLSSAH